MMKKTSLKVLSDSERNSIIRRLNSNEPISTLARVYGVSPKTIRRIKTEKENDPPESSAADNALQSTRKPQNNLSFQARQEIIDKLEAGHSIAELAVEYFVSDSTIRRIQSNKQEILKKIECLKNNNCRLDKKIVHSVDESVLDKAVYAWFVQRRSMGEPVSGTILQEKAIILNRESGGPPDFKASNGWLHRFKVRHGIHQLSMQGEKLSADNVAADEFTEYFSTLLRENNFELDQVYNADETGLYWKSLPSKTLVAGHEKNALGKKEIKDRVTVMFCANATGTHKIPLLVIGKSKKPRCFKNKEMEALPVKYMGQKSAWMDRIIFRQWYEDQFLPEVRKKHPGSPGHPRKVLLLLDNAPSHPPIAQLNAIDDSCQIMYLPPNVTALIQPMDQGVIEKSKKMYRKNLLKELLLNNNDSIAVQIKRQTLKDCCHRISNAWDLVTQQNAKNAWNKVLKDLDPVDDSTTHHEDILHLWNILKKIPEYAECTYADAKLWLEEDHKEAGWEIVDAERILRRIENGSILDDALEETVDDIDDDDSQEASAELSPKEPSIQEAFQSLTTFRRWFENRWECESEDFRTLQNFHNKIIDISPD